MIRTAMIALSLAGLCAAGSAMPAAAQDSDVAFVESVNGQVVALVQGKPTLLDALDTINDGTRVDLLAKSELRICHYQKQKIVNVAGPQRISISRSDVTAGNGKVVEASAESCVKPTMSTFQGGFIARTASGAPPTRVALRPAIKIVNRASNGIRSVSLWDGNRKKVVATFVRNRAHPVLDEGQSYHLVVQRNDGSELKMDLIASTTATSPLILIIP
jgi:hypothetical protein